jgi:hypothetical protein
MSIHHETEGAKNPLTGAAASGDLRAIADEHPESAVNVDRTRYLTRADLAAFAKIALEGAEQHGPDYFAWRNAPVVKDGALTVQIGWGEKAESKEISAQEALDIGEAKLNGAYSERWLLSAAYIISAVTNGHKVALLQKTEEQGTPFDAAGWVVVSVNGYPMFHISPKDLPMAELAEAGLVSVVQKDSDEAKTHDWKGTNKVQEYALLLQWALDSGTHH